MKFFIVLFGAIAAAIAAPQFGHPGFGGGGGGFGGSASNGQSLTLIKVLDF